MFVPREIGAFCPLSLNVKQKVEIYISIDECPVIRKGRNSELDFSFFLKFDTFFFFF